MNKNCCLYRKSRIYQWDTWNEDKWQSQSKLLVRQKGKEALSEYFMTWFSFFKNEPCPECDYFFTEIRKFVDEYVEGTPQERHRGHEIISIPPERLWIYRCKETRKCSICPFSLPGGKVDKKSEVGKHLLEGVLEGQTKYEEMETLLFQCPKCSKKWATAGEFPAGVRLAHAINRGKNYEGSKLTCFPCEKL